MYRGEPLDPEPTLFGTARINEHVAPDGSTEYTRARLWLLNRAKRYAFGARLYAKLVGDPIIAQNIRADFQPFADHANDMLDATDDIDPDELYGHPLTNWGANDG